MCYKGLSSTLTFTVPVTCAKTKKREHQDEKCAGWKLINNLKLGKYGMH